MIPPLPRRGVQVRWTWAPPNIEVPDAVRWSERTPSAPRPPACRSTAKPHRVLSLNPETLRLLRAWRVADQNSLPEATAD